MVGDGPDTHELKGATESNLSDWTQQFVNGFEDQPPPIDDEMLPVDGGMLRILTFGGEHFPYVVKSGQASEYEVPWRQGTGTRSARRRDLLNLLVPLVETPKVRFLRAWCQANGTTPDGQMSVIVQMEALVDYSGNRLLFFPKQWASAEAKVLFRPEAAMRIEPKKVIWGRWKTVCDAIQPQR